MTTLILTVMALLLLAAVQTVAGDARSAATQPFVRKAALLASNDIGARALPADMRLAQAGRGMSVRTHVARLP
jgi:hypothetical protein